MKSRLILLLLIAAPIIVHLPELAGWISCAPFIEGAGLAAFPPAHLIGGECFIDGNAGGTMEALGHLSAEDWLHGQLPWWNPYSGVGTPLAAEMQPASFFLPFILLLHFPAGILLLRLCVQIMAGIFMFVCLREIGVAAAAALAGALLFEFNGTIAWFSDAPFLPVAFLPLLIAGIERARRQAQSGKGAGIPWIALSIGFSLLAGFPETAFMDGVLALLWCFGTALGLAWPARLRLAANVVAGGLLGLCLAAPVVIPFLDYLSQASLQFRFSVAGNRLVDGQEAAMILPTLFGPPYRHWDLPGWSMAGGFIGIGTAVAGFGWLFSTAKPRFLRWLALSWTVFWCAVFLGEPLSHAVWQSLPVLNQIAVTRYAMPSIEFLWCTAAALALHNWLSAPLRMRAAAAVTTCTVMAAIAAAITANRIEFAWGSASSGFAAFTLIWAACVGAGVAILLSRKATRTVFSCAVVLLAVDAIVAFALPVAAGATSWAIDTAPVRFLAAQPGYFRSYGIGMKLAPNYGAYFAIPTVQSFTVPAARLWYNHAIKLDPRLVIPFLDASTDPRVVAKLQAARAGLEQVGVRFIVTDRLKDPVAAFHDAHFNVVFESPTTRIYELKEAAPYFETSHGSCALSVLSPLEVNAHCVTAATLERRELSYPGWHASVNGAKAPLRLALPVFQSLDLPAGTSRVRFWYSPPHGSAIILFFAAALLGLIATSIPRHRSQPTPNE